MREKHPYGEFIPRKPMAMIIGSFPIGKFTNPNRRSEIKEHEFDFFFGGEKNLLWKLLGEVFRMKIKSREDIKKLLEKKGIGIGDVILSCRRKKGGAADSDLYDIKWNHELLQIIRENKIRKVYFTSRKVEQWFNKLFPECSDLNKVTLISPSAQSVRSLSKRNDYKSWVKAHPPLSAYDYILDDYREKFDSKA